VNLSLSLIKHYAMKTYRRMELQLHAFLTFAASCSDLFSLYETDPFTRWLGDCVDPQLGLDAVAKPEILAPAGNIKPIL